MDPKPTCTNNKRQRDEGLPLDADVCAAAAVRNAKEDALAALRARRLGRSRHEDFRACRKLIKPFLGDGFMRMTDTEVLDMSVSGLARYCWEGNPHAIAKAAALVALTMQSFITRNDITMPPPIVFVSQPLRCTFKVPAAYVSIANVPDKLLAEIMTAESPVLRDIAFKKRVARERLGRRKALGAARRAIFALTGASVTDDQIHSEQIFDLAGALHPDDVPGLCLAIVRAILDVRSCIQQIAPCTTATQLTEKANERTIGELCNLRVGDCAAFTDTAETESDSDSD